MRHARLPAPLLALPALLALGCAARQIPNTDVDDTPENREIVEFLEQYRRAVEARDVGALLEMASESYYDDNGTPVGTDDVDFETLQEKLRLWRERLVDARYEIRYRRILHSEGRVYVDVRYSGSFRAAGPDGERWSRRLSDNRLVLRREDGAYRVLSGM